MPFPKTLAPDNATFLRDLAEAIDGGTFEFSPDADDKWRVSDRLYAVADEVDALDRDAIEEAEDDAAHYRSALEDAADALEDAAYALEDADGPDAVLDAAYGLEDALKAARRALGEG